MPTKQFAQVRGSVIRITRVDACGSPVPGTAATVVSKKISSVTVDEVTEDGTNIRERNFGDELQIVDDAYTSIIGYTAAINFMGIDPDMISMLTGQPVVKNAAGDTVGFDNNTDINLDNFGFSLEIWSKIAGNVCDPSGNRIWGYTLMPFLKGGRLGGFAFENSLVQFNLTGAQTRDGNGWGVGPYNVDRGAGTKETQTITITGAPTGGTYRLGFAGQVTDPISSTATSAQVSTALNALTKVQAAGGVVVTGGPHPTTPMVVAFGNAGDAPAMTATASFTGGTTPTVAVTTTAAGAAGAPSPLFTPLGPNTAYRNIQVSLDPPTPTIGAVALPVA